MTAPAAQPTRVEWFGTLRVDQPIKPKDKK